MNPGQFFYPSLAPPKRLSKGEAGSFGLQELLYAQGVVVINRTDHGVVAENNPGSTRGTKKY